MSSVCQLGTGQYEESRRKRGPLEIVKVLLLPVLIPITFFYTSGHYIRSRWTPSPQREWSHFDRRSIMDPLLEKQAKEAAKALPKETPRALPAVRKRSLTIPLTPTREGIWEWKQKQETADQLQSSLFGRFPFEVREMIYKYYIVPFRRCIHVFRRPDKRLGHYLCTGEHESHSHMPLREWGYDRVSCTRAWTKDDKIVPPESSHLLPLLKTCRRAYSEAITFLYTANIFCFQDCLSLQFFTTTTLPHRLVGISTIQLPWKKTYLGFRSFIGDKWLAQQVRDTIDMLNRFENLQEIRIVDIGDQHWSRTWRYPSNNDVLAQAMRKTRVQILLGGNVVRERMGEEG